MCEHERLRTVGDRVFCCSCGVELPLEFLKAKNRPEKAENPANKAAPAPGKDKSTTRKKAAKKGE